MEDDLNELKRDLEDFCKKYNVSINVETWNEGRTFEGTIVNPKVNIRMERY